jgi:hypothetical protein
MREAEILASNLGEGGISIHEILSDVGQLKGLAQLQESMASLATLEHIRSAEQCPLPSGPCASFRAVYTTILCMCIMPYCALYILVHMDHSELWAL